MEKSSGAMQEPGNPSPSFPVARKGARALSPGSGVVTFFCEPSCEESSPHFLDACHLCRRPLGHARDIFMYRGDTPFCSEECRQEQIELDEGREEEKAGYWRSRRRRQYRSSHRVGEPAAEAAEVQGIHNPATETAVAS